MLLSGFGGFIMHHFFKMLTSSLTVNNYRYIDPINISFYVYL